MFIFVWQDHLVTRWATSLQISSLVVWKVGCLWRNGNGCTFVLGVSQHQFFNNYWQVKTHRLLFKSSFFCANKRDDPCADFFTVRKTEGNSKRVAARQFIIYFIREIFGGKDCHVWGDEWYEETSFLFVDHVATCGWQRGSDAFMLFVISQMIFVRWWEGISILSCTSMLQCLSFLWW